MVIPRGIDGFFSTFLCLPPLTTGGGVGVITGIPTSDGSLKGIPVRSGAPLRRIVALRTESVPEIQGNLLKANIVNWSRAA